MRKDMNTHNKYTFLRKDFLCWIIHIQNNVSLFGYLSNQYNRTLIIETPFYYNYRKNLREDMRKTKITLD